MVLKVYLLRAPSMRQMIQRHLGYLGLRSNDPSNPTLVYFYQRLGDGRHSVPPSPPFSLYHGGLWNWEVRFADFRIGQRDYSCRQVLAAVNRFEQAALQLKRFCVVKDLAFRPQRGWAGLVLTDRDGRCPQVLGCR
ncbi:MAG TPA: hypothetical protein VLZ81_09310, partial [Blastocatellia bacterium]|nr:hypothetical protein [Blastocatellia bacterium]